MSAATTTNLGLNDLNLTVSSLWNSALSTRTLSAYETGLQSFKTFLIMNNLVSSMESLPVVSEDIVMLYIAHCYKTLKIRYTTIKLYLCGIRFAYLKAGIPCPLIRTDNSPCLRITALLNAVKRIQGQISNSRQPITATILDKICSVLETGYLSPYMDSLLAAVCVTAFFGFLRCAEFTVASDKEFDPEIHLCLGDLTFLDTHVELLLKSSKTDPFRQGIIIQLFKNNITHKLCPVTALQAYLARRNNKFMWRQTSSEPLFLTEDGFPLARSFFILHVKQLISRLGLDTTKYSGHSFRIGAASSACSARLEDHLIRTLGRWSSDCYRTYIRTPKQVIQAAQKALLSELHS